MHAEFYSANGISITNSVVGRSGDQLKSGDLLHHHESCSQAEQSGSGILLLFF